MTVLVCTSSALEDRCVPAVIAAMEARGRAVFRLDTARFPLEVRLELAVSLPPGGAGGGTLACDGQTLRLAEVSAVWLRHTTVASSLGDEVDEDYQQIVTIQSEMALEDAIAGIDAFHLDHHDAISRFPLGIRQLRMAERAGLTVPASLSTNDPDAVRAFMERCEGQVVAKMLHSSVVQRDTPKGPAAYSPRILRTEDLADIDRIRLCPMIFQQRIDKALELRITVVGSRLFAAAVDSSKATVCDWAEDPGLVRAFVAYPELPDAIGRSILALLDEMELNFATVDMIVTPEGRYVFLEVNGVSFFDFIVEATGLPIVDALADLLTGRVAPRTFGGAQRTIDR